MINIQSEIKITPQKRQEGEGEEGVEVDKDSTSEFHQETVVQ
jgi:hypothetical protein